MFTTIQSLYTSSRGLRIVIGIGLFACGILLAGLSGGFPPWSWRLSVQALSTLSSLWATHGLAIVFPLLGLMLNSLLCLLLWLCWLMALIKLARFEWRLILGHQQFEQDVLDAEQIAQQMVARDPQNAQNLWLRQGTARTAAYATKPVPNQHANTQRPAAQPSPSMMLDDIGYTKIPSSARRYATSAPNTIQWNMSSQLAMASSAAVPARASARSVAIHDYELTSIPTTHRTEQPLQQRAQPPVYDLPEDDYESNVYYPSVEEEDEDDDDAVRQFETPSEMHALTKATQLRLVVGLGSDPGLARKDAPNEDNLLALQGTHATADGLLPVGLFVVADGMGGHSNGQEASRIAIRSMSEVVAPVLLHSKAEAELCEELLKDGVQRANFAIYQRNHQQQHMMGTTITSALLFGSMVHIVNVGDSRTYLYRASSGLSQITRDHSLVGRLVEEGALKREDMYTHPSRNQIYRCLGEQVRAELDSFAVSLQANDVLLLCSDGLWEMVRDQEIAQIISRNNLQASQISTELLAAALRNGGADNVSVVVVCVV